MGTILRFSIRENGPKRAAPSNSDQTEGKRKAVRCGVPSSPWM